MASPSLTLFFLAALASGPLLEAQTATPAPSTAPPPVSTSLSASAPTPASTAVQLSKTSPLTGIPEWSLLSEFHGILTFDEFTQIWDSIYSDTRKLPVPWTAKPDALEVATGGTLQEKQLVDFRKPAAETKLPKRYWRRVDELPPLSDRPVLSDTHIALDPGHIGGSYAQMEERYLCFNPATPQEAVREGDSTLLVAQVLKEKLEAAGARVSLVRDSAAPVTTQRPPDLRSAALAVLSEAGVPTPPDSYAGLTGDQRVLTLQWQTEKLFYRVSEIRARADKVNLKLKPDLVVCLHLNAESWGDAKEPQYSAQNHFHVLINGCYAPQELQLADVRFEALSRIFSRIHEVELPLAETVARTVADITNLPPYVYTTPNAKNVGNTPYVYARNLLANRLYNCPVIYLEPYVMNHQETYQRLLRGHYMGRTLANGRLQTSIIEDYARGVAKGIIDFYRANRK